MDLTLLALMAPSSAVRRDVDTTEKVPSFYPFLSRSPTAVLPTHTFPTASYGSLSFAASAYPTMHSASLEESRGYYVMAKNEGCKERLADVMNGQH